MTLNFPMMSNSNIITAEDYALIESAMTTYFHQLFIIPNPSSSMDSTKNDPMYDIPITIDNGTTGSSSSSTKHIVRQPLQFHVNIADSILIGNMATVKAHVSFLYEAQSSTIVLQSQQLAETFTLVHLNDDTETTTLEESAFQTFSSDPTSITMNFASNEKDNSTSSIVLKDNYKNKGGSHTSKEVALIVVTVFLSIVLLIVSSVLLHITGGWKVCTNAMSNCLFEEIDDVDDEDRDYYNTNKKAEQQQHQQYISAQPARTYPLQYSHDQGDTQENIGTNSNVEDVDEDDTNFMDVESTVTSVLPTSASGLLGVTRSANAIGIHTMLDDDDDDEESNIYGDGMTPISRTTNNEPLGITSMRKLPVSTETNSNKNTTKGGFSNGIMMIQNRFLLRSASKKDQTMTTN